MKLILASVATGAALLVALTVIVGRTGTVHDPREAPAETLPVAADTATPRDTPISVEPVQQPPTVAADIVDLPDDAAVIGVSVNGGHRAYLEATMFELRSAVVNDVLGGTAVTLTCCSRRKVVRCLTKPSRPWPMKIHIVGWKDGQILLSFDGRSYAHDASNFPADDLPVERTTWGAWRNAHPDTDVYVSIPKSRGRLPPE
jgi:hypothetical protein